MYVVAHKAVITSGGYERYFEKNGKNYHHIIDPSTGYPAENGLTSVTIVSDDGTLADGLSTSLFIMGKEKAEKFWKKYSDKFDVILLTDDDQLYVSELRMRMEHSASQQKRQERNLELKARN